MVVGALQSLVLLMVAAGLLLGTAPSVETARLDVDPAVLPALGVLLAGFGLVQLVVVILLGQAREGARTWFGILAVFQVAAGVYSTVALGDHHVEVLAPLALAVVVLWLLYGADQSREFFPS